MENIEQEYGDLQLCCLCHTNTGSVYKAEWDKKLRTYSSGIAFVTEYEVLTAERPVCHQCIQKRRQQRVALCKAMAWVSGVVLAASIITAVFALSDTADTLSFFGMIFGLLGVMIFPCLVSEWRSHSDEIIGSKIVLEKESDG